MHHAGLADFTTFNRLTNTDEVGVEAPVESNLQLNACGLHRGERGVDLAKIKGNGLLAKNVLGLGSFDDQFCVRTRGGADKHCFTGLRHGLFCELGKGCVDFPALLKWLSAQDYKGYALVEQDVLPGMGTPKESAQRNREYIRSIETNFS